MIIMFVKNSSVTIESFRLLNSEIGNDLSLNKQMVSKVKRVFVSLTRR